MDYNVPTLGDQLFLNKPQSILAYVIGFYAVNQKSTSNTFYDQAISLQNQLSRYGGDRTSIQQPIKDDLITEFTNIFTDATEITVEVTTTAVNATNYTITISPSVTINNQTYTVDKTVTVNNGILLVNNDLRQIGG